MSQVNNTVPQAARQSTENPDIMFVLRHYVWLIVVGTILGTGVGTGLFFFQRWNSPTYVAERHFQVLAPQVSPIVSSGVSTTDPEEITRFMQRQRERILSPDVIDSVLKIEAVRKTNWYKENSDKPAQRLKEALKVTPEPQAELLNISMSAKMPSEAATIVDMVAQEYKSWLEADNAIANSSRRDVISKAVAQMQSQVDQQTEEMKSYRINNKVDAILDTYNIGQTALASLQGSLTTAEANLNAATANFDNIQKQVNDGTLDITPEIQRQVIDNNPQVSAIESMKMNLNIDRSVLVKNLGQNNKQVKDIDDRLDAIERQKKDIVEKLRSDAVKQMQENASQFKVSAQANYDYVAKQKDFQEVALRDMDRKLVVYKQMEGTLAELTRTLDDLNTKKRTDDLSKEADLMRVREFETAARQPGIDEMTFPKPVTFVGGGLILGMLGSFGIAYLLERTNTRVRTPRDITRAMELPLLGFIPDQQDDNFSEGALALSVRTSPASVIAESFRQIRGRLTTQANGKPLQTLLIASMSPGGGATTVASNIANGMALNDVRVLLIDANFYRPGLGHSYRNLPTTGLGELICGKVKLEDAVVASEDLATLHLMGPGMMPAVKVSELMESRAFRDVVLPMLKSKYDLVIFDGAPMNLVSDSIALGAKVDGVIAVVRAGAISKGMVARVRDQLKQVHANLVGLVLNAAQIQSAGYFRENYRTFYKYAGPSSQRRTDAAASVSGDADRV